MKSVSHLLNLLELDLHFVLDVLEVAPLGRVLVGAPLGVLLLLEHSAEVHAAVV